MTDQKFCRYCGGEMLCYRSDCYERYRAENGLDRPPVNWMPVFGICYFGIVFIAAGLFFKSFEEKVFFIGALVIMWFVNKGG